jgi:hypothetical protein
MVEHLYDGDKRVDVLVDEITDKIYEMCEGRLTLVSVIGILELVKAKFLKEMTE